MVDSLEHLINFHNRAYQAANQMPNPNGPSADPPAPITVDNFDLSICRFEDEIGEEPNEELEDD